MQQYTKSNLNKVKGIFMGILEERFLVTYITLGFQLLSVEAIEQQSQEQVENDKVAHNQNWKINDETSDVHLKNISHPNLSQK